MKNIKLGLYVLLTLLFSSTVMAADLQVYQCLKCRECVKKNSRPSSGSCPETGGSHNWNLLGAYGSQIYLCDKCQILVHTQKRPSSYGCINGSHTWNLLGQKGEHSFQCRKCRILIRTESRPSSAKCSAGGSHNWQEL